MKQRKSDILWKVVMEEVFDDLLCFIYPDAGLVYDMDRGFEFLEKELAEMYPEPDKASDIRLADKLVKIFHRDGEEEWVLIHVEIQGDTSNQKEFAERMFRYFYRIFDRYRRPVLCMNTKRFPSWIFRMRNWLGNYVLFEDPEMNRIFIEQIYSQDKKHVMGIDEYIKWEAIEEERESFVKNLLRGTDFPDEKIASLANVNLEFVNEVKADLRIK